MSSKSIISSKQDELEQTTNDIATLATFSKYRLAGFYLAITLIVLSLIGLSFKGLNLGLDFTGGYMTEFSTSQSIDKNQMKSQLTTYLSADFELNSNGLGTQWTIRQADGAAHIIDKEWLNTFTSQSGYDITPQDSVYIGSQVGSELIDNGSLALLFAAIAMMMYLTWRFEWRLACGSLVALMHDVLVVLGLFAWYLNYQRNLDIWWSAATRFCDCSFCWRGSGYAIVNCSIRNHSTAHWLKPRVLSTSRSSLIGQ